MRMVGNVIWFVFGGWYLALLWLLGAVVFAITIIGLPLTRSAIEMAKMSAFPFGKDVVHINDLEGDEGGNALSGTIGFIFNVLWLLIIGWALFVLYIVAGIISCITIILIPFGLQSFKLAGIGLWPVGRRVVTKEMADIVRKQIAQRNIDKIQGKTKNPKKKEIEDKNENEE